MLRRYGALAQTLARGGELGRRSGLAWPGLGRMPAGDLRAALAQHLIRHLRPAFFPDWRQIDDLGAGGHEIIAGMQFDELVNSPLLIMPLWPSYAAGL